MSSMSMGQDGCSFPCQSRGIPRVRLASGRYSSVNECPHELDSVVDCRVPVTVRNSRCLSCVLGHPRFRGDSSCKVINR